VRELINVLQSVLVQSLDDSVLYPQALPLELRLRQLQRSFSPNGQKKAPSETLPGIPDAPIGDILPPYQQFRRQTEKQYLQQLMSAAQGRIPRACEISGLSRARIYQLMTKHDLKPRKSFS
jgi:two-component system NtrC family response regulator